MDDWTDLHGLPTVVLYQPLILVDRWQPLVGIRMRLLRVFAPTKVECRLEASCCDARTGRVGTDGAFQVIAEGSRNAQSNLLVAARTAGVRRVIYAGSSSAYGDTPTLPKHEEMPPDPISPYAVAKLVS
jgi:NAD dependent epimerase/dehydratase family